MSTGIVLTVLIAVTLVVTVVGAVGSRTGRLRRNAWFGIRTRATQRSDDAWRRGQAAGWRRRSVMVPVYALALVATVVATADGSLGSWAVLIVTVCGVAGIVSAVWSVSAADRAARSD